MGSFFEIFGWWIAVVEIPALSALFWLIRTGRREVDLALHDLASDLADHKLHIARHYARNGDLRELEGRITSHLLRIEAKLDVTALKAEASIHSKG